MHRKNPTVLPTATLDGEPSTQPPFAAAGIRDEAALGVLFELPPGRETLSADIRTINHQCFLMLCNMHHGLLSSVAPVPPKLVVAAQNLLRPQASADWSGLWTMTLIQYRDCLADARKQILAAARLHGLGETGRDAVRAIEIIENVMPTFLEAASRPSAYRRELKKSARQLGRASVTLTESLNKLLGAVEAAVARTNELEHSGAP